MHQRNNSKIFCIIYFCIILFMHSVNGTQFLNITYLLALFAAAAAVFATAIVPLINIKASL